MSAHREPGAGWSLPTALAVALGVTWPLPKALLVGEYLGHPTGDLADHVQGAWWVAGALAEGRWPLTTWVTHLPDPQRLWFVDPVGALLMAPGWGVSGPFAWNMGLLLQVLGATVLAWWVGRRATGSPWSGTVTAVVAVPSAYLVGLLHGGLSEYAGLAAVVAAVWWLLRALGRDPQGQPPARRDAWIAGLAMGLAAWQAPYYGVFAALFALCCVPGPGWRARLGPLVRAGAVAVAVAAPLAVALWWTLAPDAAAVSASNAPGWAGGGPLPATDLLSFVWPGRYYFPDTPSLGNPGILHVNALGWVALALAGLAVSRRSEARPLRMPAALYGVLLLGPGLVVAGQPLGVPLPLALLYAGPSPFDLVHHPYRLVAVAMVVLGLLAGLGSLQVAPRWRGLLAVAVGVEVALATPAPWPLETTPPPASTPYVGVSGGVLDWPPGGTRENRRYQLAQVEHGQPVPWGVNVFLSDALARDPLVAALLGVLDDPTARARNRDVPGRSPRVSVAPGPTALRSLGVHHVVLHHGSLSERERDRATRVLTEALGVPAAVGAWGASWTVPDGQLE